MRILFIDALPEDSAILIGPLQSPVLADVVAVGRKTGRVAINNGSGVKVGSGVGLAASVGGGSVAVGFAISVAATIVHAAATAVFCTSAGLIVGVAGVPQAVRKTTTINRIGKIRFNI